MAKPKLTIIGLGRTGASLGLALQLEALSFELVGHDKDTETAAVARKAGAVDKTEWNLHKAYADANMVILAVPFGELAELFAQMKDELKPNCTLLCLTKAMQPTLDLAAEVLPASIQVITADPILTGMGDIPGNRADLFEEAIFCIAPSLTASENAVELCVNLISRVKAQPLFIDPIEHDGVVAGVEQLPRLMAMMLMRMMGRGESWRDGKKLAGRQFAQSTEMSASPSQMSSSLTANRANIQRWMSELQAEMDVWAQALAPGNEENLTGLLEEAVDLRLRWEHEVKLKEWDERRQLLRESAKRDEPSLMRQMFMGNIFGGRRGEGK